jgi:hypothetical protein
MTEAALRAYLLGQLPDSEAELVETRLIEDADLFSQMETAEDDLFDAFARGRLTPDERDRFLQRFGAESSRRRFANTLARRTSTEHVVPFVRRRWVGLALAAGLVMAVGAYLIPRQPEPSGRAEPIAAMPAAAAPAPVTSVIALALGTSRAAGAPVRVVVDRATAQMNFRIRLNPADRYPVYTVEIRSTADNVVWGDAALQSANENGDLVIHAVVPADRLPSGNYEIGVRGGPAAAALEDLGFLNIEVSRAQ